MISTRQRLPHLAYFGVFLVVGLSFGMIGPSISLLAEQVDTTLASVGILLVTYGLGYLCGTQLFARGYDRAWGNRLIAASLVVAALCLAFVPLVSTRAMLATVFFVLGAAVSTSDVGCNTLIVWELRDRVGPSLVLMHTMFGVGAIASPLIVRGSDELRGDPSLGYWFAGAVMMMVALFVVTRRSPQDPHTETRTQQSVITARQMALIVMFFLAYVALEVVFVTWIYTYGTKVGLSKTAAAVLTSTYWVGFMLGRFATVVIARRGNGITSIQIGAVVNIAMCVVMLMRFDTVLVPCAIVYGLAVAPQFPLMFAFIGNNTSLSGKMTSRIVGTAGLSSTVLPWLAGQLLEGIGVASLPIFLMVCAVTVIVATRLIASRFGNHPTPAPVVL